MEPKMHFAEGFFTKTAFGSNRKPRGLTENPCLLNRKPRGLTENQCLLNRNPSGLTANPCLLNPGFADAYTASLQHIKRVNTLITPMAVCWFSYVDGTLKSITWTYPCLSQTGVSPRLYFLGQHFLCAGGAWSGSWVLDKLHEKEASWKMPQDANNYLDVIHGGARYNVR